MFGGLSLSWSSCREYCRGIFGLRWFRVLLDVCKSLAFLWYWVVFLSGNCLDRYYQPLRVVTR